MRNMLKSKLHRARVTEANLSYEGSISILISTMRTFSNIMQQTIDFFSIHNNYTPRKITIGDI